MNLQALMKQAQSMQKKLMDSKNEIEKREFVGKSELVEIKMLGNRKVISTKIKENANLDLTDIEILEDMFVIASNDALSQIEIAYEKELGSQAGNLGGLF